MEPFENDRLTDAELDAILRQWEVPQAPARLRSQVFPETSGPAWRRLWRTSFRVPLPVAAGIAAGLAIVAWQGPKLEAPRVIIKTERIEIPVVTERVVTKTVYRDRAVSEAVPRQRLLPVTELRPLIIRGAPDEQ